MSKVLIKGGRIVTAVDDYVGDILVDYSLFEGREVQGKVKKVFLRGEMIVDGDDWLGKAGMGQYLSRAASGRFL